MTSSQENHHNIFISYEYLQVSKLFCKYLDLVHVVQQVINFFHFAHEGLAANEENDGQAPPLVDFIKDLPCLHWSFANPHVHKFVVRQIVHDDRHCLLGMHFVVFLHFHINVGGWRFFGFIDIVPSSTEANPNFNLNFQRLKFSSLNLSMTMHRELQVMPSYA